MDPNTDYVDSPSPKAGLSPIYETSSTRLMVEPESLEGVASAYRYKLTLKNESLLGSTLHFVEGMDVFSFAAVDKKRALKKEEWPAVGSMEDPRRFDIRVQLLAGNVEIPHCDGCASWKEKTRQPFLILTPTGERVVQFTRNPFLLLIFRCCPKFHSCNKQFRLVITATCAANGETLRTDVNIYRKKMVSSKKRKASEAPLKVSKTVALQGPQHPKNMVIDVGVVFPLYPYKPSPQVTQPVVSPQLMYELLYDKDRSSSQEVRKEPFKIQFQPILVKKDIHLDEKKMPTCVNDAGKCFKNAPFGNFDAHPQAHEIQSDERWLDSVLSEMNGIPSFSFPKTLDDISALLDLPEELPEISFG